MWITTQNIRQSTSEQSYDVILALKGLFSTFRIPNVVVGEFKELVRVFNSVINMFAEVSAMEGNGWAEKTVGTVKALIN